jgi:plastocyanin
MPNRRLACLYRLLPLSVLVATLWPQPVALAATVNVTIADTAYHPSIVIIRAGDTVTWQLQQTVSGTSHTVTSDDGTFDSPTLACPLVGCLAGTTTFSFTFRTAGTYRYHCKFVTSMHGTVTVASSSPTPSPTPSPSPTPRPSPSPSPTPPPPPSPAPSHTPSPSPSPSRSPTPSPSATPSPSPTLSATQTAVAAAPPAGGGGLHGPAIVAVVAALVALACGLGLAWLRRSGAW